MTSGTVLTFSFENMLFALDAETLHSVIRCPPVTPMPLMKSSVLGLLNLRGKIVTLHDLGALLDLSTTPRPRSFILILAHRHEWHGFAVDQTHHIIYADPPQPLPGYAPWHDKAEGMISYEDQSIPLLNNQILLKRIYA